VFYYVLVIYIIVMLNTKKKCIQKLFVGLKDEACGVDELLAGPIDSY